MAIDVMIAAQAPEGYPHRAPDGIAEDYGELRIQPVQAGHVIDA